MTLAVHATHNAIAIESDGQLRPRAETSTKGFGSYYRDEADDRNYVFFNLGDKSYYLSDKNYHIANQTKAFVFDLDRLLDKYKAIVRFENPTYTRDLNTLAETNFNVDGVSGTQARSMITQAERYKHRNLDTLEIIVKGSVDLSDVVSTE